ncbi:MAG: hypothetical protein PHW76_08890 [Alphaproteobacteria bacterium]|nr:hypothetical protein [Alphaproteobacteria bacterium]
MESFRNTKAKFALNFNEAKAVVTGGIKRRKGYAPSVAAHTAGILGEVFLPGIYNVVSLPVSAAAKVFQNKEFAFSSFENLKNTALVGMGEFLNMRTLLLLGSGAAVVAISGCLSDVTVQGGNNSIAGDLYGSNITFGGNVTVEKGAQIDTVDSYFKDCVIHKGARVYCDKLHMVGCEVGEGAKIQGEKGNFLNASIHKDAQINTDGSGWTSMKNTSFGEASSCQSNNFFERAWIKSRVSIGFGNGIENVTAENDSTIFSNNDLKDGVVRPEATVGSRWTTIFNNGVTAQNFEFK